MQKLQDSISSKGIENNENETHKWVVGFILYWYRRFRGRFSHPYFQDHFIIEIAQEQNQDFWQYCEAKGLNYSVFSVYFNGQCMDVDNLRLNSHVLDCFNLMRGEIYHPASFAGNMLYKNEIKWVYLSIQTKV
jgi:hypothetical protein